MTKDIFGKLFGDKGYVSKMLADLLWGNGIQMVAKTQEEHEECQYQPAGQDTAAQKSHY